MKTWNVGKNTLLFLNLLRNFLQELVFLFDPSNLSTEIGLIFRKKIKFSCVFLLFVFWSTLISLNNFIPSTVKNLMNSFWDRIIHTRSNARYSFYLCRSLLLKPCHIFYSISLNHTTTFFQASNVEGESMDRELFRRGPPTSLYRVQFRFREK